MTIRNKSGNNKTAANGGTAKHPPINKQPQSKSRAAVQTGMFLFTDDKWSLAYFDPNDLHCQERELFG
ncbi:MAG TPA: hypothetical protein VN873_09990 [Candidatus Angelobacter sp.]|nr:hypothetical protein [Candidatus Angelobacter sp.]